MIDFKTISKEELEQLEEKRKQSLQQTAFAEQMSTEPIINELRFNHGFYQIGPFLINGEQDKLELVVLTVFKQLYLHFIGVNEKQKSKGTKIMEILCDLADKYEYEIVLQIDETKGTPKKVLEKFYQTFGFHYTDEEYQEMTRMPIKKISR